MEKMSMCGVLKEQSGLGYRAMAFGGPTTEDPNQRRVDMYVVGVESSHILVPFKWRRMLQYALSVPKYYLGPHGDGGRR